ncbi:head-tail adaptor protein [Advenella kashmirensis W13003]|uniref:Head-tail adaptor protein n=1 Tax=Advenella kashmirensis W13003 TaxID=1424334 RepID=V8QNW8_9BURK|nr:phage head closure protein [Advenella kashmirensis]ETF00684.1 head-tail adaptor protein [Advenella kashmirensis W13003]
MALAHKLIHRVVLQRYDRAAGTLDPETGDRSGEWKDMAVLYANVTPLSSREFLQAGATQSEVTARITVRYREDIRASDRIVFRGKIYNLHGIQPDNKSGLEYLTMPVSQGVNNG